MAESTLIITRNFHPNIGGVETYITEFIKCYFRIKKYSQLYIICPIMASLDDSIKQYAIRLIKPERNFIFTNVDHEKSTYRAMIQTLLCYIFILFQGCKLLFREKARIDNIYAIGGPFAILPSLILVKIFRKRCFGHIHADFQFMQRSLIAKVFYRFLLGQLDRIFVNSEDVLIDLIELGVHKEAITIIHNWVDKEIFKIKGRENCRQLLKLPLDKRILLFVGRLSQDKGILELIDCIDILKERKDLLFLIIGDGPLRPLVTERLKNHTNALFLGPKKNFELVNYYNAVDVLLWGSIDTRYVSIIIIEALHCGLPVIAPITTTQDGKIGVSKYYVRPDTLPPNIGLLFNGDVTSLIRALTDFFNMRFNREEIYRYALEKYSEMNADPIFSAFDENDE